ncbi:AAA family ATPase [Paenibacillus pabuli]|uniref:AAA family ATPase n=1 Tax=Paenibacillus pabuli TaxID=1472 RepID=UPI001FFFB791|nr:AAA family ATPase [Paenibacillus pabuli]UPK46378.1 AAA family ATPase [Paenibacillus pabuli]
MFFLQMSGFPGSGKSTLSRQIAKITGAIIIDHDISKSSILKSMENSNLELKVLGMTSYNMDWALIEFYLSQSYDVIFDSPCFYSEMIERGSSLSQKYNAKYKYVECYLNDYQEISKRLQHRERMISQISGTSEEDFRNNINESKRPNDVQCLLVDSSQPIETYLNYVLNYIDEE